MSLVQDLIDWGAANHAILNSSIEIYQDPITGLSFKATQNLPPNTNIVTCSYQISLSYLNAIEAPYFPSHSSTFPQQFLDVLGEDDPNIIGHFFLMQQYLMREKSFWYLYIRILPQPRDAKNLAIPIWWPEEDRRFLAGTNAEPPIEKRQALWREEWRRGRELMKGEEWEEYGYELYQWAATIFGSRSFRASLTISDDIVKGEREREHFQMDRFSVLLPILDIGNHDGVDNARWESDKQRGNLVQFYET